MAQVSVICPVFNRAPDLLHAAIGSVLEQPVHELILCDDGSTAPATLAALAALPGTDPRIRLVRLPRNRGPAAARNAAAAAATGEWLSFLDSDDLWTGDRLSALRELLAGTPGAAWFAGRFETFSDAGAAPCRTPLDDDVVPEATLPGGFRLLGGRALVLCFIRSFALHLGAMCVRREAFIKAGAFPEHVQISEDVYLQARLALAHGLAVSDRIVYRLRLHDARLTGSDRMLRHGFAEMPGAARRDPAFAAYRRELRWSFYSATKRSAMLNLLSGHPWRALRFAVAAYAADPREVGDLATFLRMLLRPQDRAAFDRFGYAFGDDLRALADQPRP